MGCKTAWSCVDLRDSDRGTASPEVRDPAELCGEREWKEHGVPNLRLQVGLNPKDTPGALAAWEVLLSCNTGQIQPCTNLLPELLVGRRLVLGECSPAAVPLEPQNAAQRMAACALPPPPNKVECKHSATVIFHRIEGSDLVHPARKRGLTKCRSVTAMEDFWTEEDPRNLGAKLPPGP